jgi:hypothetical protein
MYKYYNAKIYEKGVAMNSWMKRLAVHYRMMRTLYPDDRLMVVFDIDDTILDLRHMILHVLASFDRHHDTNYFDNLSVHNIDVGEMEVRWMLSSMGIPRREQRKVEEWFRRHSWSATVICHGHRPFPGAMSVIRWLQSQENTFVGLNTGRPEYMREETLVSLNAIGKPQAVAFSDNLLFMNAYREMDRIPESKVDGMKRFQALGFRIVGFVDNEPENLKAVGEFDRRGETLLLHADTFFSSDRGLMPNTAVSGKVYDISELVLNTDMDDEYGEAA